MFTKQLIFSENSLQLELKEPYKGFKLGESHFVCFEDLENWSFNASAASKEFHIANLLTEVYKKTKTDYLEKLLIQISEALQNYDIEDVTDLNTSDFHIYKTQGIYISDAKYIPTSKQIVLFVNAKCLQDIKDYKNIPNILSEFKRFLVHEDTHKQQDEKSVGKFFNSKKYIGPDSQEDYINQRVEIDAYARQYGSELRELYPDESTDDLFKRIFSLNIKRERLRDDLNYILSHLTVKNQKFFLRNIYDYLENEEE